MTITAPMPPSSVNPPTWAPGTPDSTPATSPTCVSASGPGDVEQDQHRQVAAAAQAVDVDALVGRRGCPSLDLSVDCGVDVDVVAVRTAMVLMQGEAEPGEVRLSRSASGTSVPSALSWGASISSTVHQSGVALHCLGPIRPGRRAVGGHVVGAPFGHLA